MFGFWKQAKMIAALKSSQKYYREMDLGQELTERQMDVIIQVSSFK